MGMAGWCLEFVFVVFVFILKALITGVRGLGWTFIWSG